MMKGRDIMICPKKIWVPDDSGTETECEAHLLFEDGRTGKKYIVYTRNDSAGPRTCVSIFNPDSEGSQVLPIVDDNEWNEVKIMLSLIQQNGLS